MSQKPLLFLLMLVVLLTACSPSAADMTPVSTSPAIIQSPPASVSSPTATAISATIPKHGDLIFIEFFAVT